MFSEKEYKSFISKLNPIIVDTYEPNPTEENLTKGKYFFQRGYWANTQNYIYFYNKENLASHKTQLLSLCRKLPKYHQPNDHHSGTISAFDLLPNTEILESQSPQDLLQQIIFSEHFTNLLCAAGIATTKTVSNGEDSAFLIILDKKYRDCLEKDGQEPADD